MKTIALPKISFLQNLCLAPAAIPMRLRPILPALGFALLLNAFSTPAAKADDKMENMSLIAVLTPTEGNKVSGTVVFEEVADDKIKVTANVTGLEPNSKHGFHVHQYGDITKPDGASAGGHFNPKNHDHALPAKEVRHVGDLGNLETDATGTAQYTITVDNMKMTDNGEAIIGRSVIVHAKADDGGQPTGNAGDRVAMGVIGVKNPGK